jgi:two-component system, NtrC family, nitrogen regulation sensor histidine kinase GlnL
VDLAAAIVESLTTPLLVVERDGRVCLANPAAGLFWRITSERMREFTVERLFPQDARVGQAVARAIESEAPTTVTGLLVDQGPDSSPLILRAQVDPVLEPGQAVERVLIVLWDETHQTQLESAAREEQLMASLGMMVRRVAHELQNPLSGIKGATQLLARRLDKAPEFAEFPGVILKELERLERLIHNMLSYGAEPPLSRAAFNLHELLDEVLWFVSNSGLPVELVRDYDPSLPDLLADRDRMHQVFLNLIRNAAEASPAGGTVRVHTGGLGPWQEREQLPDPAGTYFRVEVEDEGAGVSEEQRARLFTPFFTTKRSGTGLGLAISYQIVRAHEGVLRYRAANPHGAVFAVLLPIRPG